MHADPPSIAFGERTRPRVPFPAPSPETDPDPPALVASGIASTRRGPTLFYPGLRTRAQSIEGQKADSMAVEIECDQTALTQLMPVVFKNTEERHTNDFRNRAVHAKLNDAGEPSPTQSQQPGEVQILSDDDGVMGACVVQNRIVGISDGAEISPMAGGDSERRQKIAPPGRQVFVDDQDHDARSS